MLLAASQIGSGMEVFLIPTTIPSVSINTGPSFELGGNIFLEWTSFNGELYGEKNPSGGPGPITPAFFDIAFATFFDISYQYGGAAVGSVKFSSLERVFELSVVKGSWAMSNTPSVYGLGAVFTNTFGSFQTTPNINDQTVLLNPITFAQSDTFDNLPATPAFASQVFPEVAGQSFRMWNAYPGQVREVSAMAMRFMAY